MTEKPRFCRNCQMVLADHTPIYTCPDGRWTRYEPSDLDDTAASEHLKFQELLARALAGDPDAMDKLPIGAANLLTALQRIYLP